RADVPVAPVATTSRASTPLGDLRQLKRLADDRFGNASRLLQFCFVGASGMVVDLTLYALFQWLFGATSLARVTTPLGPLYLVVSGALSVGIALSWNFTLNRYLTFSYAKGGSIVRQFLTYALSNALGIALSFSLRLLLPMRVPFFAQHKLAAAVVGIVAATGISFTMARWLVFRPRPAGPAALLEGDLAVGEPEPAFPEIV
ncbi:MAG TPA: GtrA family protein, partial [Isosphaeraceae bacterium]